MPKTQKKRAPKPSELKKDDVIRMRVTADQRQILLEAAARSGLELSAWLRQAALRAAGAIA